MASSKDIPKVTPSAEEVMLEDVGEDNEEDEEEVTLATMLSEQVLSLPMVEPLPPTPVKRSKAKTTAMAPPLSSPALSTSSVTPSKETGNQKRTTVKSMGKRKKVKLSEVLGSDDSQEEDILPSSRKGKGKMPPETVDDLLREVLESGQENKGERVRRKYERTRGPQPIEFTSDGRGTVLLADIETVRKTKEKVDALISVLERTREKLIANNQEDLKFTEPPSRPKRKPERVNLKKENW